MIPAVVLAAGTSTRMGRPKAMLPLDGGETFLARVVRTLQAAGVEDVVVVLGHAADAIAASVVDCGLSPRFVVNDDYESGQLSSLLTGLLAVDRPGVAAMLLTLVDVPLVSESTVRALLDRYRDSGAPVVRPVHGGQHGHPVIVDRGLFGAIRSADPESGAKAIIRTYVSAIGDVEVNDEGAFVDIDTPEDYSRVLGRSDARRR